MSPAESIPLRPFWKFQYGSLPAKSIDGSALSRMSVQQILLHKTSAEYDIKIKNTLKQGGTAVHIVPCTMTGGGVFILEKH